MKPKKTISADLNNKRGLFFQMGLIASLGIAIAVFSYDRKERIVHENPSPPIGYEPDIYLPPRTKDPITEASRVKAINPNFEWINIVPNDREIKVGMDEKIWTDPEIFVTPVEVVEEKFDDEIFIVVEQMPSFMGGDLNKFRQWVASKLVYPQVAIDNNITGKVNLTFVVEKDGSLTGVEIIQSPDRTLADEAERVLKLSPKWSPGKQRDKAVRVRYSMPVDFILSSW